jgi:hypothetical protein
MQDKKKIPEEDKCENDSEGSDFSDTDFNVNMDTNQPQNLNNLKGSKERIVHTMVLPKKI